MTDLEQFMDELAKIKGLSVAFQTPSRLITAVDQVNFSLKPGETLSLLGESGCGKSITSLALMRLLPMQSVYGVKSEIHFAGKDLLELPEYIMRTFRGKRLAMIFQEPMTALNPVLSIEEQLAEALQAHEKLPKKILKERMLNLLTEVEMPEPQRRLKQYPHQLSGGQKQRVVIAMALASNPQILIADEPTTALDVTIQAQILRLLKKLQQQYQMSLLLITHDLGVVKEMADQVCVMYAGHIVEFSNVYDFFNHPLHPYSQQLLLSLPSFAKRRQSLQAIKGNVPSLESIPGGCRFHPRCAHAFEICPKVKPELQTISVRGEVRCHLYPELTSLPPLNQTPIDWPEPALEQEVLLEVKDLSIFFSEKQGLRQSAQGIKAVDQLSFSLRKGQTLALVGESGCGKTTTAKAILRLIETSGGEILYRGKDIFKLRGRTLREFRKKVQIIFQDPFSSMNPRMTVAEILSEGMQAQYLDTKRIRQKCVQLLEQVNLPSTSLHRYPHQFSGGQRQRICIARALAVEPEILICDEPTSALDISVQAQILNLLKHLQYEYGLSYLFITHNMGVVSYMADEVLVMKNGHMVEQASCKAIFTHPQTSYTVQLLSSVLTV